MSSAGPRGQHILIVEDDPAIAAGLALNLKLAGHRTSAAEDGLKALSCVQEQDFDMILLDINLPHRNGLEVLQSLRAADNLVPVIVLSARDGEFDKVAALRLGADDYLTKPFALAELLARMEAVLRRAQANPAPPAPAVPTGTYLRFGEVVVDVGSRTVTRGGQPVKLTHLEFELLLFFARNPSQVFRRDDLFRHVWGQTAGSARTVDNFVGQLHHNLETDPEHPKHFITVRGSGYRFQP
jgi:two-component system, OmpR family, alkaline phosphatase synthesis response regulator PhoP